MHGKQCFLAILLISTALLFIQLPGARAQDPQEETGVFGYIPPPVNYTAFWRLFNQYSAWDLEANTGSGWFSVKQDLTVEKNYTDPGTCKITLTFSASYSADYRLTFGIDLRVRNYTYRENLTRYFLEYQNYTVFFDFSDLLEVPQLQFSHGVTEIAGKDVFWFRARRDNVPLGAYLELDPTFGYQSQGGNSHSWGGGDDLVGCVFTCTENGIAESITAYLGTGEAGTCTYKAAIYKNSDLSFVAGTGEETYSTLCDWRIFTFSGSPELVENTEYLLCIWGNTDFKTWYTTGSTNQTSRDIESYDGFPSTFTKNDSWDEKQSIYCTYSMAPTLGEFVASASTVYNDEWFSLNCSLNDGDGIEQLVNCTLALNGSLILAWDNATATFSINQDPNSFCTLNASACIEEETNSTAFTLSWRIKLTSSYPTGAIDVLSSSTAYDSDGGSGSGSESGVFTFALRSPDYGGVISSGTKKKTFLEEIGIQGPLPSEIMVPEAQYGSIALVLIMGGAVIYYLRKPRSTRELYVASDKKASKKRAKASPKPKRKLKKRRGGKIGKW